MARASLELSDEHGMQPVHYAAFWGKLDVVKLLLAERADVGAKVGLVRNSTGLHTGDRPVHLAAEQGHLSIVKSLAAHKHGSVCDNGAGGRFALEAAASKEPVAQWLRANGGQCRPKNTNVFLSY